jgi:hypothetical protein
LMPRKTPEFQFTLLDIVSIYIINIDDWLPKGELKRLDRKS